jgi:hypothetical protein
MIVLVLAAFLVFPVIAKQRSEEGAKDMKFAAGAIWGKSSNCCCCRGICCLAGEAGFLLTKAI